MSAACYGVTPSVALPYAIGFDVWVHDEEPVWGRVEAFVRDDDGFEVTGLASCAYRLSVVATDWGAPLDPDVEAASHRLVRAPDTAIVVDLLRSRLTFEVRDDERILRRAVIGMDARTGHIDLNTGLDTTVDVVVTPNERRTIVVEADEHEKKTINLMTPPPGQSRREVITLARRKTPASDDDDPWGEFTWGPVIDVKGPDGAPLDVPCRITADGQPVAVRLGVETGSARWLRSDRLFAQPTSVTPALKPGHYVLTVGGDGYEVVTRPLDIPEDPAARPESTPPIVLRAR